MYVQRLLVCSVAVPFLVTFPEACSVYLQCVLVYCDTVSVWSLTCDRVPSMFVFVRCFPSGPEYKWVFVLLLQLSLEPRRVPGTLFEECG